ncbi:DUF5590 domain-containing protein [Amphibacillus indicireducens]|uniref:Cell wall elongation regulator TseB-like domain-containing protein n=1 Tax=Amphibacillus indicireducens TaxID=1076330 RepID=A0ABP7VPF9_9BACI
MKTNLVQSIKISRLKLFLGLLTVIVIGLIGYSIYLYQHISETKTENFQVTEARVNEELTLNSIHNISSYHGNVHYHVVEGETNNQEALLIFVDQADETADLIVYSQAELISDDVILADWESKTSYQDIYQIQYGIRNEIPLLEIVYLDHSDRLSYDYYRLDTGAYDSGISFANKSK